MNKFKPIIKILLAFLIQHFIFIWTLHIAELINSGDGLIAGFENFLRTYFFLILYIHAITLLHFITILVFNLSNQNRTQLLNKLFKISNPAILAYVTCVIIGLLFWVVITIYYQYKIKEFGGNVAPILRYNNDILNYELKTLRPNGVVFISFVISDFIFILLYYKYLKKLHIN